MLPIRCQRALVACACLAWSPWLPLAHAADDQPASIQPEMREADNAMGGAPGVRPLVTVDLADSKVVMRNATTGEILLSPRNLPLAYDYRAGAIKPDVEVLALPDGFDLVYTFHNDAAAPKPLGGLAVGFLTLGQAISYMDPSGSSSWQPVDATTFTPLSFTYPSQAYSPVMVLRNEKLAVGITLQYPILEYRHDAKIGLINPKDPASAEGEGGRGWGIDFQFSNFGDEQAGQALRWPAEVPAGGTRVYVVSVRVEPNPDLWQHTLLPYRDFFRSLYGTVTYQRDARPVIPWAIAETQYQTQDNPLGFFGPAKWRPDIFGWVPMLKVIQQNTTSFKRVLLSAPGGLYPTKREHNPPFFMTSPWKHNPQLMTAMDPKSGLRMLTKGGKQLGLWWGHSLEVPNRWDPGAIEPFDLNNPAHVNACYAEMDLAVQAGATLITLDGFAPGKTPLWDAIGWLRQLKSKYPKVRFCTAPLSCDILHTQAAGLVYGWREGVKAETMDELLRIRNPHYLADAILPGHETWGAFRYDVHRQQFRIEPTVAMLQRDMQTVASHGYVPIFFEFGLEGRGITAAESWKVTLPPDMLPRSHAGADLTDATEEGREGFAREIQVRWGEARTESSTGEVRISRPLIGPSSKAGKTNSKSTKAKPKSKSSSSGKSSSKSVGSTTRR